MKASESSLENELADLRQALDLTNTGLQKEKENNEATVKEREKLLNQVQMLKGERNRWKQKADGLVSWSSL